MNRSSSTSESLSFQQVAKGLVALHRLTLQGKDDSPEADRIRDTLDSPLSVLSKAEKERARWLSEDLYSISEPSATGTPKDMNPQAQRQLNEAYEARQNREWDRALALLRRWQDYITPALLSYLRGSIWLEVGNSEVAAEFYRHASQTEPNNAYFQVAYLNAISNSDPKEAEKQAREILAVDDEYAPVLVAIAAEIRFDATRQVSDMDSIPVFQELISLLERNLIRLEADTDPVSPQLAYSTTVVLLGLCHQSLGNVPTALQYFSRGLQLDPNNSGLLVARGMLQYGKSPNAISDFEEAINLGSSMIWPYLFLAHHYLLTSRFEQCRKICEYGMRMEGSQAAKSQLEECRAIAQAELGFPPELVRGAFESAIRLDPANELAKQNLARYEEFLKQTDTTTMDWEQRTPATVRNFGISERRHELAA